jgi:ribosomal protein S18 acetylase RimI-like enzyme
VTRFRPALAGDVGAIVGMMRGYYGQDGYTFIEAEARARAWALEIAEAYCRAAGVNALHLEVESHRETALELYRRGGFADYGRFLMTKWLNGSRRAPRRCMSWERTHLVPQG